MKYILGKVLNPEGLSDYKHLKTSLLKKDVKLQRGQCQGFYFFYPTDARSRFAAASTGKQKSLEWETQMLCISILIFSEALVRRVQKIKAKID